MRLPRTRIARSTWPWVVALWTMGMTGCGASYTKTGLLYMARGSPAVALEYLDAGQQKRHSAANRGALLRVYQLYVRDLQREIDFLKRQKQAMRALSRVTLLEEVTRRGVALKMPDASLSKLEKDLQALSALAQEQLDEELAERMGRGQYLRSDLAVCRQLLALQSGRGGSVARRCERLREHFKHYAVLSLGGGSLAMPDGWVDAVVAAFGRRHPELLALVGAEDDRRNARLVITVGRPATDDTDWHLTGRSFHRKAVKIRDRKGRLVRETIKVPPTEEEIERAKKLGQPPPKERLAVKQLYRHTAGELRRFARVVRAAIPVMVRLERDTEDGPWTPLRFTARLTTRAMARYERYEGDPEANPHPRTARAGARANAERQLPSPAQLLDRLTAQMPDRVARTVLERVE